MWCVRALSCWNKDLLPDTAYHLQQYDVIMMSGSNIEENSKSKRYHQNFVLFNNNEITACIADLFNIFCEEVYVVVFFKVVQQLQMMWEIQLHVCGQILSVCNSERIIKIGQYLRKLCSNEKGPVRTVWLPDGKKSLRRFFGHFDRISTCERWTDIQTSCHGIVRAMHMRCAVKIKLLLDCLSHT